MKDLVWQRLHEFCRLLSLASSTLYVGGSEFFFELVETEK